MGNPHFLGRHKPTTHTVLPALRQSDYSTRGMLLEFIASLRDQAQKAVESAEADEAANAAKAGEGGEAAKAPEEAKAAVEAARAALKDVQSLLDATESLTAVLDEYRSFVLLVAYHAISRLSPVTDFKEQLDQMHQKLAASGQAARSQQSKETKQNRRQSCFELWNQNTPWLNKSNRAIANLLNSENEKKKPGSQFEKDVGAWKREWNAGARA